jgi:hypothetical protein
MCYYCSQVFKSREALYSHVVTHAKRGNESNQKIDDKPQLEEMNTKNENTSKPQQMDIDHLKKRIKQLQERIDSHTTISEK